MRKKSESTLISLKLEKDLLAKLDDYCQETGMSRTTAIARSVEERLSQYTYSRDIDSLRYLQENGQWYEWNDDEGNWNLPGCGGILKGGDRGKKDLPKPLLEIYDRFYDILDTGDFKKLVTCKGVNGVALIWAFSRIFFDREGKSHDQIEPYVKKTIALMKRRCKTGVVFSETGDDGMSDYRIYWFVPGSAIMDLEYGDILNARKIMEGLFS